MTGRPEDAREDGPPVRLTLRVRPETLAVAQLPAPTGPLPDWVDWRDPLVAVVRRDEDLTVVCPAGRVPTPQAAPGLRIATDWRALEVDGPLDFALTGILADLSARLARAGISVFAVSTFETDLVLVRGPDLAGAIAALDPPHCVHPG